ncbi:MAG: diguanylate cyclase [Acidobacteriota bacterium]|nr:diguanylate cyclase [Acidobacteriota bacterium]
MAAAPRGHVGILPAVYFPHLRLGSVMYQAWHKDARDTQLAFRGWTPAKYPPPFGCYVPRLDVADADAAKVRLIAHVARVVDALSAGKPLPDGEAALVTLPCHQVVVGVSSWTDSDEDRDLFILDADYLWKDARVAATSVLFALPLNAFPSPDTPAAARDAPLVVDHVPLLYFQADVQYDAATFRTFVLDRLLEADAAVRRDLTPDGADDAPPADDAPLPSVGDDRVAGRLLLRTMRAVAELARLRARTWIHPNTRLLTRAGFAEIRRDVQYRTHQGHSFAELFFDIDHFKELNDRVGYDGADAVAREIAEQVRRFAQSWLDEEYRRWRLLYHPRTLDRELKETIWRPDAFRAFIAHVSGDEFKLYVRTDDPIIVREAALEGDDRDRAEAAALNDYAEGLLGAVRLRTERGTTPTTAGLLRDPGKRTPRHAVINAERVLDALIQEDLRTRAVREDAMRIARTTPRLDEEAAATRATLRGTPPPIAEEVAATTISLGIARLWVRVGDRPPAPAPATESPDPSPRDRSLRHAGAGGSRALNRTAIVDPDHLKPDFERLNVEAERALDGAKKRGRNRKAFFHEILNDGGSVVDVDGLQVRISLGSVDFVREGDEFDVFAPSTEIDRAAQTVARAERRAYRATAPWVARVRVYKVWPREAMAHVVNGRSEDLERGQWLRFDQSRHARAVRFTLLVPETSPDASVPA